MNAEEVIRQAEEEFRTELFRAAVESHKVKMRNRKTMLDKIFPWRIIIIRKDAHDRH